MEAKKTKTKRRVAKPKYPFFHDMAEATDDPEWQQTFRDMAVGKFPVPGLYVVENSLVYKPSGKKKPEFEFAIPDDPKSATESLIKLLYQRLSVNRHDVGCGLIDYISQHCKAEEYEWSKLKSAQQVLFVADFAERYANEHHLTPEQSRQMQVAVEQAIMDKRVKKNDVVFVNNRIVEIKSLKCAGGEYYIERSDKTVSHAKSSTTRRATTQSRHSPISKLLDIFVYYLGLRKDHDD